MDVIRGYPSPNVAYIGLLMTAGGQSRRGLGREIFKFVLGEIRRWHGVSVVRLGIVASNAEVAVPFWQSLGFARTGESKPHVDGPVSSTVTLWEYPIPAPNSM
ncbi:GNAT family N-acetyltransferase [Arthrobacter alpinus]|uniref:GNAT family N-acetyltransferase n=1 Tax=Arthrobacter alpinus TaxID=656366 RepID=UPI000942B875